MKYSINRLIYLAIVALLFQGCTSNYWVYKDLEPTVFDGKNFSEQVFTQDQFDSIISNSDAIDIETKLILFGGVFDFKNKPVRYTGLSECYASVSGSITFLHLSEGAIIKNLVVYHSPLDGIEITGNVKIDSSKILHSCDEAITLRERSKLEITNSVIKNSINKGIIMKPYSELVMDSTKMYGEQFIAPCGEGNRISIKNSSFYQHPQASYGQIFSGDDCIDVEVNWYKSNKIGPDIKFNAVEDENEDIKIFMIDE